MSNRSHGLDLLFEPAKSQPRGVTRNHPVPQPRSHRATGQIQCEHMRPRSSNSGAAGDTRATAAATSAPPTRLATATSFSIPLERDEPPRSSPSRDPAQRRQQPAPMKCHQICHSPLPHHEIDAAVLSRLPSSYHCWRPGWCACRSPIAGEAFGGQTAFTRKSMTACARFSEAPG